MSGVNDVLMLIQYEGALFHYRLDRGSSSDNDDRRALADATTIAKLTTTLTLSWLYSESVPRNIDDPVTHEYYSDHHQALGMVAFREIAPTAVLIALTISAIHTFQAEPSANVAIKNQSHTLCFFARIESRERPKISACDFDDEINGENRFRHITSPDEGGVMNGFPPAHIASFPVLALPLCKLLSFPNQLIQSAAMQQAGEDTLGAAQTSFQDEPSPQRIVILKELNESHGTSLKEGEGNGSQDAWPDLYNKMQELVRGEVEALANIFTSVNGACVLTNVELSPRFPKLQEDVEKYLAEESRNKKDHTARFMELWIRPADPSDDGMCLRQIKVQLRIRLYDTGIRRREWNEHFICRQKWAFWDPNAEDASDTDDTATRRGSESNLVYSFSGTSGTNAPDTSKGTSGRSIRYREPAHVIYSTYMYVTVSLNMLYITVCSAGMYAHHGDRLSIQSVPALRDVLYQPTAPPPLGRSWHVPASPGGSTSSPETSYLAWDNQPCISEGNAPRRPGGFSNNLSESYDGLRKSRQSNLGADKVWHMYLGHAKEFQILPGQAERGARIDDTEVWAAKSKELLGDLAIYLRQLKAFYLEENKNTQSFTDARWNSVLAKKLKDLMGSMKKEVDETLNGTPFRADRVSLDEVEIGGSEKEYKASVQITNRADAADSAFATVSRSIKFPFRTDRKTEPRCVMEDSVATARRFYTPTIPSSVDGTVLTRDFGYPLDLDGKMSGTTGWKLESVVSNRSVSGPSQTESAQL
ncbi:hypothetical protein FFLO_04624 [Filobasidium floriforme]|uniref:Uncharacterized protein n=1 Tax=Filobasidium floriforme TaxID=5210 RepID=A0A8K0JIW3_9TREE|nr:uncharacterized protein HD553DRAFT_325734 [Filobasidium floriforme]KAG7531013.1 hypothetical protein FFLO_04624 [Filobasidium floriforme]KAH8080760.1 hypothetical protein HD553DRAFT_325734 [Filobasidium floriforme]